MYYYIVDPQKLPQKDFERVQNVLYSSLSEFRIAGEVVRVTGLRTIQQLVENAFAHEAKTIVAVGGDDTLHDVINAVGKREITIGFIPIVDSEMSGMLGIKDLLQAVKTIAFRRIQDMDLGLANNYSFLSKINFGLNDLTNFRSLFNLPTFEIKFSADESYQATQTVVGGVIMNSTNPTDGLLDVLLLPKMSNWNVLRHRSAILTGNFDQIPQASIVHVKKIEILEPKGMPLKIGSRVVARAPAQILIQPKALKMIVGKDRNF
jgi:diacylglycerol kinase family enzyme